MRMRNPESRRLQLVEAGRDAKNSNRDGSLVEGGCKDCPGGTGREFSESFQDVRFLLLPLRRDVDERR